VPPEPPVLYTARATSSSLVFHWRLSSNGDAPITGYTMTYHSHPKGAYKQVSIPRHTTSYYLNVSIAIARRRSIRRKYLHAVLSAGNE